MVVGRPTVVWGGPLAGCGGLRRWRVGRTQGADGWRAAGRLAFWVGCSLLSAWGPLPVLLGGRRVRSGLPQGAGDLLPPLASPWALWLRMCRPQSAEASVPQLPGVFLGFRLAACRVRRLDGLRRVRRGKGTGRAQRARVLVHLTSDAKLIWFCSYSWYRCGGVLSCCRSCSWLGMLV